MARPNVITRILIREGRRVRVRKDVMVQQRSEQCARESRKESIPPELEKARTGFSPEASRRNTALDFNPVRSVSDL